MRELLTFHLLSGHAWFSAGFFIVLVAVLDLSGVSSKHAGIGRTGNFLVVLAVPVAALSGTPFPLAAALPLALIVLAYAALKLPERIRRASAWAVAISTSVALAFELPFHSRVAVTRNTPARVYVIGDSISSGGFEETRAWPERLAEKRGIEVTNLARPSETLASAISQVELLPGAGGHDSVVVLEIGGNDMLDGVPPETFGVVLNELITTVRGRGGHRVVMLELPIPPGRWSYGLWQRRLARRHGVTLVPKRVLAEVLLSKRYVTDGLHPSDAGHARLAELVGPWLQASPLP